MALFTIFGPIMRNSLVSWPTLYRPWATEEWFYDQTKAGQTILEARRAMRNAKVDNALWFGLATAGRE